MGSANCFSLAGHDAQHSETETSRCSQFEIPLWKHKSANGIIPTFWASAGELILLGMRDMQHMGPDVAEMKQNHPVINVFHCKNIDNVVNDYFELKPDSLL